MAETVGTLNVEIKGRADALDRTLRTTERNTIAAGSRMEKSLTQALSFGKLAAGIKAVASATEIAFAGFEYITARIDGNLGKAYESANNFATKLKAVPLFGDLVKLGQFVGSGFVDDDAEAAKIQQETEANERRQQRLLKSAEDAQRRIRDLTRETAMLGAPDDAARKRMQAQFALDDATSGISGLDQATQDEIRRLAEQRFKLDTRPEAAKMRDTLSLSATNIGLGMSTRNVNPPDKRGQEKTNSLLQAIYNIQARRSSAVAG